MGSAPRENSYTSVEQEMHIAPFFYKRRKVFKDNNDDDEDEKAESSNRFNESFHDDELYSMDYGLANGHSFDKQDGIEKCLGNLSLNDCDITIDSPDSSSEFELVLDGSDRERKMEQRRDLTDEDILAILPKSQTGHGDARALVKCKDDGCQRIATAESQGYCSQHFCELYRKGKIDVKALKPERKQSPAGFIAAQTEPEYRPAAKSRPKYSTASDSNGRYVRNRDLQIRDASASRERTHKARKQKPSRICSAPLCTRNVFVGEVCEPCSLKFQASRPLTKKKSEANISEPKTKKMKTPGKWKCAYKTCDNPTNTKGGLCTRCHNTLLDANASKVEMPKPEVMPPRHKNYSSPRGERVIKRYGRSEFGYNARGNQKEDVIPSDYHCQRSRGYRCLPDEPYGYDDEAYSTVYGTRFDKENHRPENPFEWQNHGFVENKDTWRHSSVYGNQLTTEEPDIFLPNRQSYVRAESPPPASLMSDITTSTATDDDYSLVSYVSQEKPRRCKSTGCEHFGNKACKGFCNSCFERFS